MRSTRKLQRAHLGFELSDRGGRRVLLRSFHARLAGLPGRRTCSSSPPGSRSGRSTVNLAGYGWYFTLVGFEGFTLDLP